MASEQYRLRNWADYNKSLINRGSLTLWFDEDLLNNWYNSAKEPTKGRPKYYSELAIEISATLRALFKLTLRATQGFVGSLFKLMSIPLQPVSYSQLSRRSKTLDIQLKHNVTGPIHMAVDSTGLQLFGEGMWKRTVHGKGKHRMWRKLHIGLDEATQQVVACKLTDNHSGDNAHLASLLDSYQELDRVSADKGYDGHEAFDEIARRGADPVILTQRKAKVSNREVPSARDKVVKEIESIGREEWKSKHQYHRRSLVETHFHRYKSVFGTRLQTRLIESQEKEAVLKCNILNKFISMCKPDSYKVESDVNNSVAQ